jgi:hypothetical protein
VIVKNAEAFKMRYGWHPLVAGEYDGLLDNAGERIQLGDAADELILDFEYDDRWHPSTDGGGFSLVISDELADYNSWNSPENWRPSSRFGGSPGAPDPTPDSADADGDGLPDHWELAHGTDPHRPDADDDPDGDGMTNFEEYLAGTDPMDAGSFLGLEVILIPGDTTILRFEAQPSRSYTIQQTSHIESAWSDLAHIPASTGSWIELQIQTGDDVQFYRLICHLP